MVTFLSGGTGTPKLLDGATAAFTPDETTVVVNTGDDVELGGLFVSPDVDTLLFQGGGVLDRETWWGIDGDTHRTHEALSELARAAGRSNDPNFLPPERQTSGRELARWRRFSGAGEFMTIGDRDRALHLLRTSLLDEGKTLSEATAIVARAFGISIDILPMSDDPVATLIHTDEGLQHFQEFWVARDGEPAIETVEYRGSADAEPAPGVLDALEDVVVIGPSNPVTSIGPMLSLAGIGDALAETTVVAVSPFLGDEAFSGPAAKLMAAVGAPASTAGLGAVYPFADAFVVDERDESTLDRPTVETDIRIDGPSDAERVVEAVARAIDRVE
ncbi:2-phospho-L-lactate transferase [Halovivax limisalsi]|uniref:2-phospho-L-lactate transferase n=1 Tax=Halovivax limisalsi TaxID=1453760 RepID=UPI001FFD0171|nr:2-phospho-L-lactate transferase [Halovivax limisalsi]